MLFSYSWFQIFTSFGTLTAVLCHTQYWTAMCGNQRCWHRSNIAADPGCVRCILSSTVCLSCVGITIRSTIRRKFSRTCNLFPTLYQYWAYEQFMAFWSRFSTKLSIRRMFLSFIVAAAMTCSRTTFRSFIQYSGVSFSIPVLFPWSKAATIPAVIISWLVSTCACCCLLWVIFVFIVGGSLFGDGSSCLRQVGSTRLKQWP